MWRSKPRDQQSFYQTIEDFGGLWKRDKVVCKNRKHKTESTKIVNKNKLEKMCAATNNTQYNFNHDNRQNNTDSNSNNSTNTLDKDKCEKLKRFILIGVLAVVGIIGWHIYGECCKIRGKYACAEEFHLCIKINSNSRIFLCGQRWTRSGNICGT